MTSERNGPSNSIVHELYDVPVMETMVAILLRIQPLIMS